MADLIERQAEIDAVRRSEALCRAFGHHNAIAALLEVPSVDAIPVVRCKDCKHRPTGTNRDDLEFPDDKCPCKCEDYWYSWKPSDDWFCGNGERMDGE